MPGAQGLPDALHTSEVTVTRRGDGGYTLAISGRACVDPTPQQLRFSSYFLPMFAKRWQMLSPGDLQGWQYGHETRSKWALDRPTPMERVRILDPRPSEAILRDTLARARRLLPALGSVPVQAGWAGYIDSTPDGVPVIDVAQNLPGFILAAGFSGHGFFGMIVVGSAEHYVQYYGAAAACLLSWDNSSESGGARLDAMSVELHFVQRVFV
jgi:glycine/D-amino acid oxidase-like deaminating enzyme